MTDISYSDYSANTLKEIINTYEPDIQLNVSTETKKKYLIHLIKTNPNTKSLGKKIFDLIENKYQLEYKKQLIKNKINMIKFIQDKKEVLVNEYVLQFRFPNDSKNCVFSFV